MPPAYPHRDATHALGMQLVGLVAEGHSVMEAADELGIGADRARTAYDRAISRIATDGDRKHALARELHTLNLAQRGLMGGIHSGDARSVNALIKIMDRRAKYLGLDAALKLEINTEQVADAVNTIASLMGDTPVTVIEGEAEVTPLRRPQAAG